MDQREASRFHRLNRFAIFHVLQRPYGFHISVKMLANLNEPTHRRSIGAWSWIAAECCKSFKTSTNTLQNKSAR